MNLTRTHGGTAKPHTSIMCIRCEIFPVVRYACKACDRCLDEIHRDRNPNWRDFLPKRPPWNKG